MKALLFDMDGVLVDVSRSYREAIKMTVRHFIQSDVSGEDIQFYKERGGLNNDWDLTLAILKDRGAAVSLSEVIDVFQGFYAGKNFDGLIRNERWLLDRAVLDELASRFRLGIVTGRPSAETQHTLLRFDAASFFPVVVTMDDLPPGRGKPDPLGIRLALSGLRAREGYYAGDGIDDMRAAAGAGLVAVGIIPAGIEGESRAEALLAHGASCVLSDINRIKEVVS